MSKFREIFWRDKERPANHVWYLRADLERPMPNGPWNAFDGWELRLYPYRSQEWAVSFARGYALKGSDGWGYTGGGRSHPQSMSVTWYSPIGQPIVPTDEALRKMGMSEYMELQGILKKIHKRWPDLGVIGARSNPAESQMKAELEEYDRRDGTRFVAVNFYDDDRFLATVSFESIDGKGVWKDVYTALVWFSPSDTIRIPFSPNMPISDQSMRKLGLRGWMLFEPAVKLAFPKVRRNPSSRRRR